MRLDAHDPAAIGEAVRALQRGELVAFPTETVYGLGADASNGDAVADIFRAKGRPADHPLIVHVPDAAAVDAFASDVPAFARRLIDAFWPGPLTLVLQRRPGVADAAAGGQDTIGLRCPSHPAAQALLHACAAAHPPVHGVAGPSATQFGRVSPTTAAHVEGEFGPGLLVLDGGACDVGIESAIVDCSRGRPVLLRPGMLDAARIEGALGEKLARPDEVGRAAPRASGTLEAHYAPRARVRLMEAAGLQAALDLLGPDATHIAVWSRAILRTPSAGVLRRRMPDDAGETARLLFAVLRDFDAQGVQMIWVETLPAGAEWDGVRDRLQRAAAAA